LQWDTIKRKCRNCLKKGLFCHFVRPIVAVSDCEARQLALMKKCPIFNKGIPIYVVPDAPHLSKCYRCSFNNWYISKLIYINENSIIELI